MLLALLPTPEIDQRQFLDVVRVIGGHCGVLKKENNINGIRIRKLTPKECWRLMGFQ